MSKRTGRSYEDRIHQTCNDCGLDFPQTEMKAIDLSSDDEYYPEFIYVCGGCLSRV